MRHSTPKKPAGRVRDPGAEPGLQVLLFAVAASLLAATLVDLAVETALAGSPFAWWVVAGVATAFVVLALLWKRTRWPARVLLLLFTLLGLAAGTACAPAGLERGLVLAGQPTGTVLAGLATLALLLGGAAFLRWSRIPLALRIALAVLAAYGAAGFAWGAWSRTPFLELLHGQSLFTPFPRPLQAAVVGVCGVLPLAFLGELGRGLARVRGSRLKPWIAQLATFGAALAVGWTALLTSSLTTVLAPAIDERGFAVGAGNRFRDDAESLHLVFRSSLPETAEIAVTWQAIEVEGLAAEEEIGASRLDLAPGDRGSVALEMPPEGFAPGRYAATVEVDGELHRRLEFDIDALYPPALALEETEIRPGFNLARAALGGRVTDASSRHDSSTWKADHLIDASHAAWSSRDPLPQEVVFGFHDGREAAVAAVLLDTRTDSTREKPGYLPRQVEIWASTSESGRGFTRVGGARLPKRPGEWTIPVDGTRARAVKVRFLNSYGREEVVVAEVKVIEDAVPGESILADLPRNLARPDLGGAVARFTSQYNGRHAAVRLLDGEQEDGYWRSRDAYLPQDLVFAFDGNRVVRIGSLRVFPAAAARPDTRVKTFSVSVSSTSPLDGFEEVGVYELETEPKALTVPIDREARFLRLRILENHGGRTTSLGGVEILEAEDGESVLFEPPPPVESAGETRSTDAGPCPAGGRPEAEPNDTPAEADALAFGRFTCGAVDPLGESDYFSFTVPDGRPRVLTLDLLGRPFLRTSVELLGPADGADRRFDPGRRPVSQTSLSWRLDPGPYRLHVTEPPISLVLIWDTSGSMRDSTEDLASALESYVEQVRPSERLQLVRFSGGRKPRVEVVLDEFTGDRARLRSGVEDKVFARGNTPFYDAVARGFELLEGVAGNRAVVVMTDGQDTSSRLGYTQFWELIEAQRIRLYTIGLGEELETFDDDLGTTPRRILEAVALATDGRAFFARHSEELLGFYEEIAGDLRRPAAYALRPWLSGPPGTLEVAATGERLEHVAAPRFALILDASGSMVERQRRIDGRLKMEVAHDVMARIVEDLPEGTEVALRTFGHRIREGREGDCRDSELLVPLSPVDKPSLVAAVRGIRALGTTPLAYSITQAIEDLAGVSGERHVIVVTDGKEECGGDPVTVVRGLVEQGLEVRFDVVGFDLAEESVKQEMRTVAEISGGRFYDSTDAETLTRAIQEAMAVPFDALDAAGERVAAGRTGQDPIEIPEGVYTVRLHSAGEPIEIENVRVVSRQPTRVELRKEGEEVGTRVVAPPAPATAGASKTSRPEEDAAGGTSGSAAPQPSDRSPANASGTSPGRRESRQEVERLLQAAEARYRATPDPADVAARATALGRDPDRILAFVRDEIAYEPYDGSFRGARGTLLARAGNSLDQSLLLRALLAEAGVDSSIRCGPPVSPPAGDLRRRLATRQPDPAAAATELGIDRARAEEVVRQAQERERRLLAQATGRESRQEAERLWAVVEEHLQIEPFEGESRHCWVRVEADNVAPSGARPDSSTAQELSASALEEIRDTVRFELIAHLDRDGESETTSLLDVGHPVEAIGWESVELLVIPADGELPPLETLAEMDAAARLAAIGEVDVWRPILLAAGAQHEGPAFGLDGRLHAAAAGGRAGGPAQVGGALRGGLDGLAGAVGGDRAATALESVELRVTASGRTHRRTVWRRGGERFPLLHTRFLVDTLPLPDGERERRALGIVAQNATAIRAVLAGEMDGEPPRLVREVSSVLTEFVELRRRILAGLPGEPIPVWTQPNLFVHSTQLLGGDEPRLRQEVDIMENRLTLLRRGRTDAWPAFVLGVFDTALEAALLGDGAWSSLKGSPGKPKVSERDGRLVVAWDSSVYWDVDPLAANCVGRAVTGEGQAMVQYALGVRDVVCTGVAFLAAYSAYGSDELPGPPWEVYEIFLPGLCAVSQGTWPLHFLNWSMQEIAMALWEITIRSLAGLGAD